jgi:lysophospholipase L1-like esterase
MMVSKKRIMCFGDSLTWGWVPVPQGAPTTRYPFEERWTGILAAALGEGFEVLEEGLSARTTNFDDALDSRLNGANHLPAALASHFPLDLVVLFLGTNDTKSLYGRSPYEIATGMSQLIVQVATSGGGVGTSYPAPKILVVAPPPLGEIGLPWLARMFEGGREKSAELADQYAELAAFFGVGFLDAGSVVHTDGVDGIHFTKENNAQLGSAVADEVRRILS